MVFYNNFIWRTEGVRQIKFLQSDQLLVGEFRMHQFTGTSNTITSVTLNWEH